MDGDSWRRLFRDLVDWYCNYWIYCDVCLMDERDVERASARDLELADCPIKKFLDRAADLEDAEKRRG